MRALIQRVTRAAVSVDGAVVGEITEPGLVVFVGVTHDDGPSDVEYVVRKTSQLRILHDELSVLDAGAPVLVVSQFTLYGETRKGRRPSWSHAAGGPVAEPLVDAVVAGLRDAGVHVAQGQFGADMQIDMCADGPVTLWVESPE